MSDSPDDVDPNAPRLDFLWKNKKTISRDPVKIADIILDTEDNPREVKFFDERFMEVMKPSKDNGRLIMFVDAIGMFQTGKTTVHKALTRNIAHQVGNAIGEETHGIYIDGPYEINKLITGYGLQPKSKPTNKTPQVYFLDIEGFDGFKNANNSEAATKLYQKMSIPFIGLSAVHILMVRENEGMTSFENIFSAIQLSELSAKLDAKDYSKLIFGVTRCQNRPFKINFSENITKEVSNKVSDAFINHFLKVKKLDKYNVNFRLRCLPEIDPSYPLPYQIPRFIQAFDIFAEDIFGLIDSSTNTGHVRYYNQVISHFNVLRKSVNTPQFTNDAQMSFKTQAQLRIEQDIQEAISEAEKYLYLEIEKIENEIMKSNDSTFDMIKWNRKVNKYDDKCLEIFDNSLLPGILMSNEAKKKKIEFRKTISEILHKKGIEIVNNIKQEFSHKSKQKMLLLREAEVEIQSVLNEKRREIQMNLCDKKYFMNNSDSKKRIQLAKSISDELKTVMTRNIQSKIEITPDLEKAINQKTSALSMVIQSDINMLYKEAEERFTTHKKSVDISEDPQDDTYLYVKINEKSVDPWGKERDSATDIQRCPVNQVYGKLKWYEILLLFFKQLFSK